MAGGGEEREAPSTAGSEQSDVARLRFRTANPTAETYDIGPQRLERTTKLADVKRLIFDKWPYGSHLQPPVGPPAWREGQETYWKCAMVVLRLFFFFGQTQDPSNRLPLLRTSSLFFLAASSIARSAFTPLPVRLSFPSLTVSLHCLSRNTLPHRRQRARRKRPGNCDHACARKPRKLPWCAFIPVPRLRSFSTCDLQAYSKHHLLLLSLTQEEKMTKALDHDAAQYNNSHLLLLTQELLCCTRSFTSSLVSFAIEATLMLSICHLLMYLRPGGAFSFPTSRLAPASVNHRPRSACSRCCFTSRCFRSSSSRNGL